MKPSSRASRTCAQVNPARRHDGEAARDEGIVDADPATSPAQLLFVVDDGHHDHRGDAAGKDILPGGIA